MLFYLLSVSIYVSYAVTIWSDSGSTSGWSINVDGAPSSFVTTTSDSKCCSGSCILIESGSNTWKWAEITRSISLSQYTGLSISFCAYCNKGNQADNRDCYFEYWCSGVGTQRTTFSSSSSGTRTYNVGLGACDKNTLGIRFKTLGGAGSNFGRAWVDSIVLTGNTPQPTLKPTPKPTPKPTAQPTVPTDAPSKAPTKQPSLNPTINPTENPSKTPSDTPTAAPTRCTGLYEYEYGGTPASAYGDPLRFRTWNDFIHPFQGSLVGQQQYYYMHPCRGYSREQMPFTILGTHLQGVRGTQTAYLWYITLELYDIESGDEYLIWFGPDAEYRKHTKREPTTKTLYNHNKNRATFAQSAEDVTIDIGTMFKALYTTTGDVNELTLTIDGKCKLELFLQPLGGPQQFLRVTQPTEACYKCYTCGLFGDFVTEANRPTIQKCDGTILDTTVHSQFDTEGFGWQKKYVADNCGYWSVRRLGYDPRYDNQYNISMDDFNVTYKQQCNESVLQGSIDACHQARIGQLECCDDIIGGTFCDRLEEFCATTVCVLADGNEMFMVPYVFEVFNIPLNYVCDIPDIAAQENPNNLEWFGPYPSNPTTTQISDAKCDECYNYDCCQNLEQCRYRNTLLCMHEGGDCCYATTAEPEQETSRSISTTSIVDEQEGEEGEGEGGDEETDAIDNANGYMLYFHTAITVVTYVYFI